MPTPTKTQRLLDLIVYLAGRRYPVAFEHIMEAVPAYAGRWVGGDETARASVRRTFERDKDELRALGVPIERPLGRAAADAGEIEGYLIAREDFYLPYLRILGRHRADGTVRERIPRVPEITIDPEDGAAALEGLRHVAAIPGFPLAREAASAYRKLTFDLDPAALPATPVVFADAPPGEEDARDRLELLSDALLRRKRVRFRYRGIARDRTTERKVAPYGMIYQRGAWYLVGHDALREAVRTFRVSRVDRAKVNGSRPHTADFEIPSDFDLSVYAGRRPWELGGDSRRPAPVRMLFAFPASEWAERNGLGELVEPRTDGSAVRSFQVLDQEAFLRWALSLDGQARIQLPAELRDAGRRRARRVADLHAPREDGRG